METETTLVGTKSGVELDTVTTVDLDLVVVILPDDTELNHTLGDGDNGESLAIFRVLLEESRVLKSRGKLYIQLLGLSRSHSKRDICVTHPCRPARTRAREEG